MKKFFFSIILLAAWYCSGYAQLPEFSLHVKLFVNDDSARTVIFGYDPSASDSMLYGKETWFSAEFPPSGEQPEPPAFGDDFDFRMSGFYVNRPELGVDGSDGGPIDIRKKPSDNSFTLDYGIRCHVLAGTTNARMEWSPQSIPAIIKHITLSSSYFPHTIRLDMKSVASFVIPLKDSGEDIYSNIILRIYYNKEIDQTGVPSDPSLLSENLVCYPNPFDSRSTLQFFVKEECDLTLSGYDITGSKAFERSIHAFAGENNVDIGKDDLSMHTGMYFLRLTGNQAGKPFAKYSSILVH